MKREMLLTHDLVARRGAAVKLENISLCLMEGECTGFLGLVNSGRNLLVDVLNGDKEIEHGRIYIDGKRLHNVQDAKELVFKVNVLSYDVDDWSVAEYIGLVSDNRALGLLRQKELTAKINRILKELGLDIPAGKKLRSLTEPEKRLVDLAKAYSKNSRLFIIQDEFDGCTTEDMRYFKKAMDNIIKGRMAVIVCSQSECVYQNLSDKFIVFRKGHIVKKCNKDYVQGPRHLEKFLLGNKTKAKKDHLDRYDSDQRNTREIAYSVRNIRMGDGHTRRYDFYKGELVSILESDIKTKERLFSLLSGRCIDKSVSVYLDGRPCSFNDVTDFVRNKIVSGSHLGDSMELLTSMTVGENLLLPSLNKVSPLQHAIFERKLGKMLERQVSENLTEVTEAVRDMGMHDYIVLQFERWRIYNPKALILFEPFMYCDVCGVAMVKSFIKKFTGRGTTVVIVKSGRGYIEDISHRILT